MMTVVASTVADDSFAAALCDLVDLVPGMLGG